VRPRLWRFYQTIAAAAGALIVADGALTPVITVTSAIEGIGLSVWQFNGNSGTRSLDNGMAGTPSNFGRTCTLSAAVLLLIFFLQSAGSQRIGHF
jgi:K+ transporter